MRCPRCGAEMRELAHFERSGSVYECPRCKLIIRDAGGIVIAVLRGGERE